jgi:hypothetical protein
MTGRYAARQLLVVAAAATAIGVSISGCGHAAGVGSDRMLRVALTEYRVVPQRVQVSAGELTIVVHNDGKLAHNLAISQNNTVVDQTPPIWPGASGQLSVILAPGRYTIASTLFSDLALGEYGTLTVTS